MQPTMTTQLVSDALTMAVWRRGHPNVRLMRPLALRGAVRGRAWTHTTVPEPAMERPRDLVERHFMATRPHQRWVADLTYVATWRGFVYVAFVIEVFSRRIVGWRVAPSVRRDLALDALDQALCERPPMTARALCITAIVACNIYRSATPSGSRKPASSDRLAAAATPTTMPSRNP